MRPFGIEGVQCCTLRSLCREEASNPLEWLVWPDTTFIVSGGRLKAKICRRPYGTENRIS
jgi:hypothetical protein